ncbi:MAG: choice-of-anchor Q domain-containing protein, partial [Bacteroidota bacterium]
STAGTRFASFKIPNGVEVYGGFPANTNRAVLETDIAARDVITDATILSGDLDNTNTISSGDAYHVVFTKNTDSTTLIDGFFITGGNANGTTINANGGGFYNDGNGLNNTSTPLIRNCSISDNAATEGAGLYNNGNSGTSSPTLVNCIFSNNTATSGGGLYNNGDNGVSSPTLVNCTFSSNSATNGGGLYNNGINSGTSNPTVRNTIFWANTGNSWFNNAANTDVAYTLVSESGTATITTGDYAGTTAGLGMIYATDPLFTNAVSGTFTLQSNSPAIDAGSSAAVEITTDITGNPRVRDCEVDLGAFESVSAAIPEVSVTVSPVQIAEDNGGTTINFTFNTSRVGCTNLRVSFSVSGTATYNEDYYLIRGANIFTATGGEIAIPAGQTSATLVLQVQQDAIFEADETIVIAITD